MNNDLKRLLLAAVGCAMLVAAPGCGSKDSAKAAPEADKPAMQVTQEGAAGGDEATPAPPLSDLPENLKTEAFEYYGLGNDQPMDLERRVEGQDVPVTGSQRFVLKKIEDGKATFLVERTGGFANVGNSELSLEPDGIYAMSSTIGTITPHQLELPSKLDPGVKWTADTKLEQEGGMSLEHKASNKVVGIQKVTTKAGTFDALLIESSGPAKIQGLDMEMRTKAWFVKGKGAVKMEIVQIPKDGKKQTIVIEATK